MFYFYFYSIVSSYFNFVLFFPFYSRAVARYGTTFNFSFSDCVTRDTRHATPLTSSLTSIVTSLLPPYLASITSLTPSHLNFLTS